MASIAQFILLLVAFTALAIESPLLAVAAACFAAVALVELRAS